MTEHTPESTPTEPTTTSPATAGGHRRSKWLHGRRPAVAAITVAALAGSWALSGTAAAEAASDRLESVTASLDQATGGGRPDAAGVSGVASALDRATGDKAGAESAAPKNTAPKDAAFQRDLDALVSEDGFPGVEAFVRDADGKVRHYTAGVGDVKTKAAVPVDGRVRIASNTKTFTAATVLQLAGEGKIDLDASVDTYLPGLVRGQGIDGTEITVRQLLQQTSGLPAYDSLIADKGLLATRHEYHSPRQALDAALAEPANFAPGTGWKYSNTNYILAGMIVEAVTLRPVGEEITERVIKPLGLKNTSWPNTGVQAIAGTHPQSYFRAEAGGELTNVTQIDPSLGWAAGQLISTPSDLSTFNRALLDGKLLEPAEQEELLSTVDSPGFEPEDGWSYGLGFAKRELECGVEAWGHGGDITGFETRNLTTKDGRSAVVAVTSLPTGVEGLEHVNAAVQDAICS